MAKSSETDFEKSGEMCQELESREPMPIFVPQREDSKTEENIQNVTLERMKKEIKRSLKVTIDTIKHPESLGANRKRNRSSVQAYPSLPTTEEVTEENSTSETVKWVNSNCDRTTRMDTKEVMSTKPPDYDQSVKSHQNMIQGNPPLGNN